MNQSGTLKQHCVLTPLGSPTVSPKRSYVHAPGCPYTVFVPGTSMLRDPCSGLDGYSRVGNTGVYWVGNTGYPATTALLEESAVPSEAGPEAPVGGWSGGELCSDVPGTAGMLQDHPSGPVGTLRVPPCPGPCFPASQP